jgi:beta-fructofuranosidase
MVVGEGDAAELASARSYRSDDLLTWVDEGPLAAHPRTLLDGVDTGAMWECPQVADVDGMRVILVGAWSERDGIMRVLAVLPDGEADRLGGLGGYPVDEGPNFYAPSVLRGTVDRSLLWGWITEARDERWWREAGWAGVLSLPREMGLDRRGRLLSWPAKQIALLRDRGVREELAQGGSAVIGAQAELLIESRGDAAARVRFGTSDEAVEIVIEPQHDRVTIDLTRASSDPRAHGGVVPLEEAGSRGTIQLRVFIDGSVLEVFTSSGRVATCRLYPLQAPPWSLRLEGAAALTYWDFSHAYERLPYAQDEDRLTATL